MVTVNSSIACDQALLGGGRPFISKIQLKKYIQKMINQVRTNWLSKALLKLQSKQRLTFNITQKSTHLYIRGDVYLKT